MDLPVCCLFLLGFASYLQPALGEHCLYVIGESCICKTSSGTIDLTPLSNNGSARFTSIQDSKEDLYSFNPCAKFTDEDCKNAYDSTSNQMHIIADGDEKIVGNDTGTFTLTYSSSNDVVDKVEVVLICEQDQGELDSKVVAIGDELLNYYFELHSCYACPGGCKSGASISGYIGLVFIILVILAIVLYFVIGAIVMKVRFQATGTDLIPNKKFWWSLPILVKDGCMLVMSPCLHLARMKDGYSNL